MGGLRGLAVAALAAVAVGALGTGCTATVAGRAVAGPVVAPPGVSGSVPAGGGAPAALRPDVLPDECLLDAAQFTALVGRAVRPPAPVAVHRDDGSVGHACYADAAGEPPGPLAAINVYEVADGTPAGFVRAGGARRDLPGLGEAAAVVPTATGPTLQVATVRYLVTIAVLEGEPTDAAWRAAAAAVLARLGP